MGNFVTLAWNKEAATGKLPNDKKSTRAKIQLQRITIQTDTNIEWVMEHYNTYGTILTYYKPTEAAMRLLPLRMAA